MKTIIILLLVAWATYISAASVDLFKRDGPLSVQLTAAGNSLVKVLVMNNGDAPLNLLSTDTLLDDKRPVERITLYSNHGCKFRYDLPLLR
jgi:deuterolysin